MYDATQSTLYSVLAEVDRLMRRVDQVAHRGSTALITNTTADDLLNLYGTMASLRQALDDVVGTAPAGLVAYARDQRADQGFDPVAEYQAVTAAIDDFLATVVPLMPTSGQYLAVLTLTAVGYDWREFTPAQTNPIKIKLDVIKDMIVS